MLMVVLRRKDMTLCNTNFVRANGATIDCWPARTSFPYPPQLLAVITSRNMPASERGPSGVAYGFSENQVCRVQSPSMVRSSRTRSRHSPRFALRPCAVQRAPWPTGLGRFAPWHWPHPARSCLRLQFQVGSPVRALSKDLRDGPNQVTGALTESFFRRSCGLL